MLRTNVMSMEFSVDPFTPCAEMRRSAPVCPVEPQGFWAVTRYDDVVAVFKNPRLFSSAAFRPIQRPSWLRHNPFADSMVLMDPPEHTKLRAVLGPAFSPRLVASMEPDVRRLSEDLVDHLLALGEADFVGELASVLPARVICHLLGLDPSLHRRFQRWTEPVATMSLDTPSQERIDEVHALFAEAEGHLREVIEARRRAPADDLVSALLRAEIDGRPLQQDEIVAFLFLILVAALDTTVNLFGLLMLALTERPEVEARLRADPALVPRFVEEVLRHQGPSLGLLRMVTEETELSGVKLPAGAIVFAAMISANRDEKYFPDPDRFDLDRDTRASIPFGYGVHYCVGAPLARLEARVATEVLLARCARFERARDDVEWRRALLVRAPASLPIRAIPR